ncbi:Formin-like protein CG32138 [Papilio machaon]|nr:Formin-like protein CG32138 [Papilio machaon]
MGLITSREPTMLDGPVASTKSNHVRQPSTRNRTKPPMPDRDELENRFIKVLVSEQLPPAFLFTNTAIFVYGFHLF